LRVGTVTKTKDKIAFTSRELTLFVCFTALWRDFQSNSICPLRANRLRNGEAEHIYI